MATPDSETLQRYMDDLRALRDWQGTPFIDKEALDYAIPLVEARRLEALNNEHLAAQTTTCDLCGSEVHPYGSPRDCNRENRAKGSGYRCIACRADYYASGMPPMAKFRAQIQRQFPTGRTRFEILHAETMECFVCRKVLHPLTEPETLVRQSRLTLYYTLCIACEADKVTRGFTDMFEYHDAVKADRKAAAV